MTAVRYKVPSQAASGADTFSDNLVGVQITDGSSQMTGTNFAIDNVIPDKDSKNFKTSPFSDFLTLDDLKEESDAPTTISSQEKKDLVKFKGAKNDAGKSLFGSLKSRLLVSITRIIKKFPAGIVLDVNGPIGGSLDSAFNITYDVYSKTTQFQVESSKLFNPFEIVISKPKTSLIPETENPLRNLYSSYKKYVLDISGTTYDVVNYFEPNNNIITFIVNGNPFGTGTTYNQNLLFRPNNGITEEFFNNLDDVESTLLTKDTYPKYNAGFFIPKDNFDSSNTVLTRVEYNWPISDDNWNLQIVGMEYDQYIKNLSDTADLIDDYKSNLMVRFLSSPQLFEYDTPDQKIQSVFQLYGQNFDRVKKYIDNIAFMRNVSYDGVNNLPDVLLKNLANNLGLDTVSLFDENTIDQTLYSRATNQYTGVPEGKTFIEAEYEFYRRMLVNMAHIYKSKGTKSSINFFLKFLGAPEQLIKIDEYVYEVVNLPKLNDIENQIYDVIQGNKKILTLDFDTTGFTYTQTITTPTTSFLRSDYPIDETTGFARRANNSTTDTFFQKGSGWYDISLNHRTPDILDNENSILTGRTKTIKTKAKAYSFGEEYFDTFRTLPGLDSGFEIKSRIVDVKGSIDDNTSSFILNRKNIDIHLDSANGVNFDIYRKSRDLLLTFGSNTLHPQTGVTFAEFVSRLLSEQIPNSNVIRYKKNYITLEDVYQSYVNSTGFTPYNITDVHEFINRMSPYWTSIVEQIVPSTTLWTGGNLIQNSVFGRSKYGYKFGCQPKIIIENLYPNFENAIEEDMETLIGELENFRGLIDITGVTYYPIIEIDGTPYSSLTYNVVVSGTGNTINSAKLFDSFPMTGYTTLTSNDPLHIPLICDYKTYVNPDITKIKQLWNQALIGLIDNVVNMTYSGYSAGYENYDPYLNTTGQTSVLTPEPLINYSFFTDTDGVEKIKFTSIKYGPNSCTVMNNFSYSFKSEYNPVTPSCDSGVQLGVLNSHYSGGTLTRDILIELTGNTIGVQKNGYSNWPVFVYSGNNPSQYTNLHYNNDGTFTMTGVTTGQTIDLIFLDAANCQTRFGFTGSTVVYPTVKNFTLTSYSGNPECGIDLQTGSTTCYYSSVTITPTIKTSCNYGLKGDTIIYYKRSGFGYFRPVSSVTIGDIVNIQTFIPLSGITNQEIVDGYNNNDFSFTYTTAHKGITGITSLTSIKKSIITGRTKSGSYQVFEVLPTTKLKVYTRKKVINHEVTLTDSYFFDKRYPEDLQVRGQEQITPCCDYSYDYYVNGDYLIGASIGVDEGELIEVIAVDLDYCDPAMYYNLSYFGQIDDYIGYIGNNSYQILIEHNKC